VPAGSDFLLWASRAVEQVIEASREGIVFLFGPLAATPPEEGSLGFILIFQALPTVVFFAALMEALYYLRVMPLVIKGFARLFTRFMGISGAESLCAASNIFVGIESATTVLPHLERMTRSELCTILAAGLATIASTVLGLYVSILKPTFPNIAAHLISASLLSAPAAVVMSKLFLPETERPETLGLAVDPHYAREGSFLEAVMRGANAGGKLFVGIVVMLLAFVGLVALLNLVIGAVSLRVVALWGGDQALQLQDFLAWFFYPLALLIGVPPGDALDVGILLGERIILTEVPAYQHLGVLIAEGSFQHERSAVLAGYALCGFAHVAAVAIFTGGLSALVPGRTQTLARVSLRALAAATFACLMTAAVAGTFYGKGILLLR
jgi:CNT family concentrative nucleoside transporter